MVVLCNRFFCFWGLLVRRYLLVEKFSICKIHLSVLPSESVSKLIISEFKFSISSMATLDAFGFGSECQKDFPFQSFSYFVLVSGVVCISCKKTISIVLFCNCSKRSIPLLSFFSPFMFRVKRCSCFFSVLSYSV